MKTLVSTLFMMSCFAVSALQAQVLNLQVVNNVADPDAGTFTVKVNNKTIAQNLGFRQATALAEYNLPVQLAISSSNPAYGTINAEYTQDLYDGGTILLTLHGVGDPTGFSAPEMRDISYAMNELAVIPDFLQPNRANITVFHSGTDLPRMDVRVLNENPLATDLDYGQSTLFAAPLPANDYTISVAPAGDFTTTWRTLEADFSQDAGKHILMMPSGFLDPAANANGAELGMIAVYPDGTVVTLEEAGEEVTAKMQLIHASADPAAATVDVYVNGTRIADNIGFAKATGFMDVPAGEPLSIVIAEPNSNASDDKVVATLTAPMLDENGSYIVMVHGVVSPTGFAANPDGADIGLKLFSVGNARMQSTTGPTVEAVLFHAVTDAGTLDVYARDNGVVTSDLGYGDGTDYITLLPGEFTVDITPVEQPEVVVRTFEPDLTPFSGQAVVIFAAGFLDPAENKNGFDFGLYVATTTGTVTTVPVVTVGVSEEERLLRSSLAVSPNPAGASTTISCDLPSAMPVVLSLYDMAGRVVATVERGVAPAGHLTIDLNTAELAPGMYVLSLDAGTTRVSRALHVVR